VLAVAFPNAGLFKVCDVIGAALRTLHVAIRPAKGNHLALAVFKIAEVDDRLLKCFEAVHESSMRFLVRSVKYIIALNSVTFGAAPFAVSATASSGLTVSFSSSTPSVCTVAGSTVTAVGVGTCSITASQAGNVNYSAATPVTQSSIIASGSPALAGFLYTFALNYSGAAQPGTLSYAFEVPSILPSSPQTNVASSLVSVTFGPTLGSCGSVTNLYFPDPSEAAEFSYASAGLIEWSVPCGDDNDEGGASVFLNQVPTSPGVYKPTVTPDSCSAR